MSPTGDKLTLPYHQERSILILDLVQFSSYDFPPTFKFSLGSNSNLFERYPFLVLRLETPLDAFPEIMLHIKHNSL